MTGSSHDSKRVKGYHATHELGLCGIMRDSQLRRGESSYRAYVFVLGHEDRVWETKATQANDQLRILEMLRVSSKNLSGVFVEVVASGKYKSCTSATTEYKYAGEYITHLVSDKRMTIPEDQAGGVAYIVDAQWNAGD